MKGSDFVTFLRATDYAAIAHRDQRRKNSTNAPYIEHPIGVARILAEAGVEDVDILCAAVLHDIVEDTKVTFDDLAQRFNANVVYYVKEVTDDKRLDKVTRKKQQIEHAKSASEGAKLIKLADKLHNLTDLASDPPKGWSALMVEGYFVWSHRVILTCFDVGGLKGPWQNLWQSFYGTWGLLSGSMFYEEVAGSPIVYSDDQKRLLDLYYAEIKTLEQ